MIPVLGAIVSGVVELGKGWIQKKREVSQAKHEARLTKIKTEADWDQTMAEASQSSWKDEWLTIIFTTPFVLYFVGILSDNQTLIDRINEAFVEMDKNIPDEYWYILGVIIAASFGIKKVVDGISTLRKK